MLCLGNFLLEFLKNFCHIWNQHLWICLIAKFCEETKLPKFGTKSALFGCFLARILNNYGHILNQHVRISVIAKFCEETKCQNLGLKMPYLDVCLIWVLLGNNFSLKALSYLKSAPSNLLFAKFHKNTRMPKFGTKNALFLGSLTKNTLFRYFWARILKNYCHTSN